MLKKKFTTLQLRYKERVSRNTVRDTNPNFVRYVSENNHTVDYLEIFILHNPYNVYIASVLEESRI